MGEFENSESPYGTFDQGGNLYEWNETPIDRSRGLRGGYWTDASFSLEASWRNYHYYPSDGHVQHRLPRRKHSRAQVASPCYCAV